VVPVGIGGSETLIVRRRGVPWLSRVTVVVGPPIVVERVDGAVRRSAITELDATLRTRLQAVFDEAEARSAQRSAGRRASHQAGQGI
jgi:1-acyl-sn-glycerol-3-phosphate acyltransferase